MTATLVETTRLTKRYGPKAALADCSLKISRGEVFGILGPNGAGKSTLLRLLLGFLRPTEGQARIAGLDCYAQRVEVHACTSYMPGDARLFPKMRGRDVLRFFARVRGNRSGQNDSVGANLHRARELAERLDLDLSVRVAYMSTGMRQKLALVSVLAADTPLVILDEPTANLDPTVRGEVGRLIDEARAAGRTVVFSSHVLPEVEQSCDRVVILRRGRTVHTQWMKELRQQHRIRARLTAPLPQPPPAFQDELQILQLDAERVVMETARELAPLLSWLSDCPLAEISIEPVGLQAIYDRFHNERFAGADSPEAKIALPEAPASELDA